MATITQVRDALKTALDTITGLRVYARWEGQLHAPAAVIDIPEGDEWETVNGGLVSYRANVHIFVPVSTLEREQSDLDAYLSDTGTKSIRVALQTDRTLGGVVSYLIVRPYTEYGGKEWAGVEYLGAVRPVEVYAT